MTDDLNGLIEKVVSDDAAQLAGMEDAVWARIDDRRRSVRLGQVRAAAVAAALVVGIVNGGVMLLTPRSGRSEMRVFTVSAGLSPLSSLDDKG